MRCQNNTFSNSCEAGTFNPGTGTIGGYCEEFIVAMTDSYGDGWNGNLLYIGDISLSLDDHVDSSSYSYSYSYS